MKKNLLSVLLSIVLLASFLTVPVFAEDPITLEFSQWREPELPQGAFRQLIDQFEEQNPGIKVELLSGPILQQKNRLAPRSNWNDVGRCRSGWSLVNDFVKQARSPICPH